MFYDFRKITENPGNSRKFMEMFFDPKHGNVRSPGDVPFSVLCVCHSIIPPPSSLCLCACRCAVLLWSSGFAFYFLSLMRAFKILCQSSVSGAPTAPWGRHSPRTTSPPCRRPARRSPAQARAACAPVPFLCHSAPCRVCSPPQRPQMGPLRLGQSK